MTKDYYVGKTGLQPKQLIKDFDLNFFLGNVIKYVCRAGRKPNETKLEALVKARDNLNEEIKEYEDDTRTNSVNDSEFQEVPAPF